MIGNVNKLGTSFKGLASYLETGKDRAHPERVDWIETRNLPTERPDVAARLMAATARESVQTQKPVFHLSISFDPGDEVDRAAMRRVADEVLRDLGLADRQALIVAHRDTAHPHVHLAVNRVHPETGRAWADSFSKKRVEASLRRLEVEMGLRVVPGRLARVPELGQERAPAARAAHGDAAFAERVRAQAGPHLERAGSWAEVERGLAEHGLALRMKGRGMVVTDRRQEVKASDVHPLASRYRLEQRLGAYSDYRARQDAAARVLDARAPRAAQPAPRGAELPRTPTTQGERYRAAARQLDRDLRATYTHPQDARRAFLRAVDSRGAAEAAAALRWEPAQYGALRTARTPEQSARAAGNAYDYAVQRTARSRTAAKEAAALLREPARVHGLEASASRADEAARRAVSTLDALRARRAAAVHDFARVRELAGDVYADPGRALRELHRHAASHGHAAAARAVHDQPERFGELRSVERSRVFGLVRELDHTAAQARTPELSAAVRDLARRVEARPRAGQVAEAAGAVRQTRAAADAARQAFTQAARTVDVAARVRQAAELMAEAAARQLAAGAAKAALVLVQQVAPMLPTSAGALVKKAGELARDMALGRDRERERGHSR
ncbi:MAG TPA: relaxase/mobilization nuclease domain-containing protein [Longimicrobium sp.]